MLNKIHTLSRTVHWTPDEINFLKQYQSTMHFAELAVLLGRTPGAVRSKLHRLGLKQHKLTTRAEKKMAQPSLPKNHRSLWTLKELNFVEEHYGKTSTREIAGTLGRRLSAVYMVAHALGICKAPSERWTEQEVEVLRKHYADERGMSYVQTLLPSRAQNSIIAKAKHIGITRGRSWLPDEEHILREFYPAIGTEVAEKLQHRSHDAIKLKASKLGLIYHKKKATSGTL
ncbi:hypothetical protein KGP17_15750 [Serratia sp. JSRIV001]|uniref:hypothetical protein n=1 Tax=unclassified Serratia (in: enterobacteria) TaxID=2647522 RepID=UPI001CBF51C0|nr:MULTISPECIES: hypothetical protein [unclassified Serratia (in: enterobacteria)]UAN43933.1 hypothetical protein KGP17_15750 [Serratia sp. JSRIV001]UAN53555.1 hypothetical protein KGP26_11075 [Serratia sp. JSRIV002]UAN58176.1 hypothetical protein KGP21_03580 [Serratia sp. JSRIV004]